jgi:Cohesin domain
MKRGMFIVAIAVALFFLALPGRTFADTTLSVSSPATVAQGSTFDVDVDISGAANFAYYQLDLDFNPAVLQATGTITEGTFFQSGGGFIPGTVDNAAGTITTNADALLGPGPGLTGSGQLIVFEFTAFAPGTSGLDLANVLLLDGYLNVINFNSTDGSVTVTGGGPVPTPEPSSFLLLAGALGTLGLFSIFKRP